MRVVGTAGHVDHGKSTLVEALTGMHPDRLKEEQQREMTIELGFAWLTLRNGEEVGIVDVPGHRDFIENMLAGVGGIDTVLFVIAADEGVMPQTKEHLAIIDLLQIPDGVIVLTKTDLVKDPEWLEMVELDIRTATDNTVLENAPIIRVSARNRTGLDDLLETLEKKLKNHPDSPDLGRPRLPIDRVFTIAGFGSVVTGTLVDGSFKVGDELILLPEGLKGRVRGLQSHKRKTDVAIPGSRTAVNIGGINIEKIKRGDVVTYPGKYQITKRLDVKFRLLKEVSGKLEHNSQVKLFIGASEVLSRVRLMGCDELLPGKDGWLQLELITPVVAVRGDRYILRRPSPAETLGGGTILDPFPLRRHRRYDPVVLDMLDALQQGTPEDLLYQTGIALGASSIRKLLAQARIDDQVGANSINQLLISGQLIQLEVDQVYDTMDKLVIVDTHWNTLTDKANREINSYHRQFPLRKGIPREQLKSRLKIESRTFMAAMKKWLEDKCLLEENNMVFLPNHVIIFSTEQQKKVDHLLARFASSPSSPPSIKDSKSEVGEDAYRALLDDGTLVEVSQDVVFLRSNYDDMVKAIYEHFSQHSALTVIQFKDRFNTSRRYALAFLEHMDTKGITFRDGDERTLRN